MVVPGGGYWDPGAGVRQQIAGGALAARLAALHAAGTVLASVCTGAMLLSAAGLLRDRPAVTNKLALGLLARDGAQVRQEARVVDDGDIITAGGPMAGVDLAVRIVERYLGPDAALAAAGRLEHEQRGGPGHRPARAAVWRRVSQAAGSRAAAMADRPRAENQGMTSRTRSASCSGLAGNRRSKTGWRDDRRSRGRRAGDPAGMVTAGWALRRDRHPAVRRS